MRHEAQARAPRRIDAHHLTSTPRRRQGPDTERQGMNIIDTLVVLLKLDTTGFKRGQAESREELKKTKNAVSKDTKQIDAHARAMAEGFKRVRNELLGISAAVITAFVGGRVLQKITTTDIATGRLAKTLGTSTEELSTWTGMAHRAGGSVEGMADSISNLAGLLTKLKTTGNSEVLPFLAQAHVDSRFINESTSWTERLLMIADAFQNLDPMTRKFLGGQVGMEEGAIRLLSNSRETLLAMAQAQRETNIVTAEHARLAEEEQRVLRELEQRLDSVVRHLKVQFIPGLIEAGDFFIRWIDLNKEWVAMNIAGTIRDVALAFQDLARTAGPILEKLARWHKDPSAMVGDMLGGIFKPEVNAWLKRNIGDKIPGGSNPKGIVDRVIDGASDWFWGLKPESKKQGKAPAPGPQSSAGDSLRFGTLAFADLFYSDLLGGVEFGGDALARITGAAAAGALVNRAGGARAVSNSSSQIRVDKIAETIVVHTQATDARSIAADLGPMLRNHVMASQGASGMK